MSKSNDTFLLALKALLKEYDASIGFAVGECSDTHGLYDEKIYINIANNTVLDVDGWGINSNDLP